MLNTKLEILKHPHPILQTPSTDIDIMGENRKDYIQFIGQMEQLYKGGSDWGYMVGLAAPQVGKNWNVFIALGGEIFINPRMEVRELEGTSEMKEGCYSLEKDKYDYPTKRYWHIVLEWVDINGEPMRRHFRGRDAQVVAHEMDHLFGKTCLDHAKK